MAEREQKSQIIIIGKETLSGSKSTSGVYKNPKAEVEIYNKNLKINLEKNITKLFLKVLFEYEEATTKKDLPNFLFSLKQNGKEFAKSFWSDPDVFYKFEEHKGELIIEIDLEKYYSAEEKIKLNFSAHLECWLEESSWRGGAPQRTASASNSADLGINLEKIREPGVQPEISLDIFPTHSPGKDLKNYINADWGNPYFLKVHLENKSNNILTSGSFTLFENDKNIKDANLKKPLDQKWKTIIISEDNATWVLIKGPDDKKKNDFVWYEDDILGKYKTKEPNRKYEYHITGKIIDEFGFVWKLETNALKVNVRVPDYKINALDLYNKVIVVEWVGLGLVAVLNIALGLLIKYSKNPKFKDPKFQSKTGAGITIESFITGQALRELAKEVKDELKVVMDDPPEPDKNYKRTYNVPKIKYAKLNGVDNFTKLFLSFVNKSKKSVLQLRALRISNNRFWTAKIKKDNAAARLQSKALSVRKRELALNFADLSKILRKLYLKIKTFVKQDIVLAQKEKLRIIKQMGLRRTYVSYRHVRLSKQQVVDLAGKLKSLSQLFSKFGRSLK